MINYSVSTKLGSHLIGILKIRNFDIFKVPSCRSWIFIYKCFFQRFCLNVADFITYLSNSVK
jgi:hypothetical protein